MAEIEVLVESLWELDEDQLAAQIGDRAQAIEDDAAGLGTRGIDPASLDSIDVNVAARASIDLKLLEAGQQLFDRVNPLVYELMCQPLGNDPQTQKILDEAIGQNYTKAAGMLTPVLISGLGLAPAIATLLATLIIKKIANYSATAICDNWKQNLPQPTS
ncbi:hypothetical protein [Microcoleus asticus]|uniref:Uncharacterized protein n=1 Tax=Microcoleus asticus IPMA8 TaxID=2563858 RepID=A0ABX2D8R1_9CYAN|nr:hypothetical protein [Microcoleus asticus]NQE38538.1 hypothetical protein [Microcoleus asticus IPMA8]